jgi:bacteriocin-like protein
MKTMKEREKKRILTRILATELTNEELNRITGGLGMGTNSITSAFGDDDDDCDARAV